MPVVLAEVDPPVTSNGVPAGSMPESPKVAQASPGVALHWPSGGIAHAGHGARDRFADERVFGDADAGDLHVPGVARGEERRDDDGSVVRGFEMRRAGRPGPGTP